MKVQLGEVLCGPYLFDVTWLHGNHDKPRVLTFGIDDPQGIIDLAVDFGCDFRVETAQFAEHDIQGAREGFDGKFGENVDVVRLGVAINFLHNHVGSVIELQKDSMLINEFEIGWGEVKGV